MMDDTEREISMSFVDVGPSTSHICLYASGPYLVLWIIAIVSVYIYHCSAQSPKEDF